ncbi:unnamed protein product [Prorocentrum cordatum]|uniref:Uncharacterized protein n=1 Tax=Prorocentrum cordatum TaxID=2364126 RepID=A0ABN9VS33_9DINO|nr:unnamed protein product [Polarella glacialis]
MEAADGGLLVSGVVVEEALVRTKPPEAPELRRSAELPAEGAACSTFKRMVNVRVSSMDQIALVAQSISKRSSRRLLSAADAEKRSFNELWVRLNDVTSPSVLESLQLRSDGGLDERRLAQLWDDNFYNLSFRCFSSVMALGMIVFNFVYTAMLDLEAVLSDERQHGFHILNAAIPEGDIPLASGSPGVVMSMELLYMTYMYASACFMLASAIVHPGLQERHRWRIVAKLTWEKLPQLITASAMRSLCHVHPTVFYHELSGCLEEASENFKAKLKWSAVSDLLKFVCSRMFFLWLGLEVFLVKFRATAHLVDQDTATTRNILAAALFLFQVMGTVNLKSTIRDRLNPIISSSSAGGTACSP